MTNVADLNNVMRQEQDRREEKKTYTARGQKRYQFIIKMFALYIGVYHLPDLQ